MSLSEEQINWSHLFLDQVKQIRICYILLTNVSIIELTCACNMNFLHPRIDDRHVSSPTTTSRTSLVFTAVAAHPPVVPGGVEAPTEDTVTPDGRFPWPGEG